MKDLAFKESAYQTKLVSFIEAVVNVASGFVVALLLWRFFVVPYLNIPVGWGTNLTVTTIFTFVSVARGYLWRRFFNAGLHRVVSRAVARLLRYV